MPVIGNISNGTAQCSYLCKSVTTRSLNSTPLYRKCTLSFSLLQMRWKISLSLRVLICFRGICRYFSIHALGRQVCYFVFFSYCGTLDHSHALFMWTEQTLSSASERRSCSRKPLSAALLQWSCSALKTC